MKNMRDLCTFCIKVMIYKEYKGFYAMECMNILVCNKNWSVYGDRTERYRFVIAV